jgi:hypothetical protein
MCSHCQRESYFDVAAGIPLETISTSTCVKCGKNGAVITLDVEPPTNTPVLNGVPKFIERAARDIDCVGLDKAD